nr:GtrA family protein [Aeromicrobium sp. CFBP 8757]
MVVGGVNFGVDLLVYQVTYSRLDQGALVSKVVSTAVTSTLAYFLHRHWSFSHRARTGLRREFVLFVVLSALSLFLGLALIGIVRYGFGRVDVASLQAANIVSIITGAIFRFWAYKRWVFLPPARDEQRAS